ncbi:L-alanine exporter AlaE [Candidatus Pacearchaeota archaeon]|nr:L-alanine exporter AlaE [Candidatus Pacearchaeota archaeon]
MADKLENLIESEEKTDIAQKLRNIKWRRAVADTFSMISFSFIVEAPRELAIGMTPGQTLYTRLIGIPVDLTIGRPYGIYLDWMRKKFGSEKVSGILNKQRLKRTLVDTLAFSTAMAPIYAGALYIAGVDLKTGIAAVASGALYSTAQGAPYGIYSDFVRKMFNGKK